jgi:hypothetical protein
VNSRCQGEADCPCNWSGDLAARDPRNLKTKNSRLGSEVAAKIDRIKDVARMTEVGACRWLPTCEHLFEKILAVLALAELLSKHFELDSVDKALIEGNLLRAGYLEALATLKRRYELAGF